MNDERINLRISKELNDAIKKYSKKKNFEDRQDALRDILERKLTKGFLYRLKNLFKF